MADPTATDPRRAVPPTDAVLADPRLAEPQQRLGRPLVRSAVREAQQRVRDGELPPDAVVAHVVQRLPAQATSLTPVINATGVVLHTNLGRAPLSAAASAAIVAASGYVDVEFDLETGARAARGRGTLGALRAALLDAGDVLVVNNGAAALLLAVTVLAQGRTVVWSRGEMVEIGDGFRLPDLVESTGARVREVGTTNRTVLEDYRGALDDDAGCILKVHPSNFRVSGFSASVSVRALSGLGVPLVVDVGSGLLRADPGLPGELDITTALRDGADVVTASGDKLLGGPQAGIMAGSAELITRMRRHPMARALRVDKLTLAALEATLVGPPPPAHAALTADVEWLRERCRALAAAIGPVAEVVPSDGAAGGGSAPELPLPGWAVSLPERFAAALRRHRPPVVGRVERGACLLDLRCVPAEQDDVIVQAVRACT
ncbi:MAG TPA: L-seryl-tRNA(Sec) selenium transferase [Candidatus Dormibacteraeota bacterium]